MLDVVQTWEDRALSAAASKTIPTPIRLGRVARRVQAIQAHHTKYKTGCGAPWGTCPAIERMR